MRHNNLVLRSAIAILACLVFCFQAVQAQSVTAFAYQGRLVENTNLANGSFDLRFELFDSMTGGLKKGGTVTSAGVVVSNGLFATSIDFGPGVFDGNSYWLDIGARRAGAGPFIPLTPRQLLSSVPNALHAFSAQMASTVSANAITSAQLRSNAVTTPSLQDSAVTSPKIASGQVVKSVNGLRDAIALVGGGNVSVATGPDSIQISSSGSGSTVITTGSERPRFAWYSGSATTETIVNVTNSAGYLQQFDWRVTQYVQLGQLPSGTHYLSVAVDDDEPQLFFLKNGADTDGEPQPVYDEDEFGDDERVGTYFEWEGSFHFTRLSFTNRLQIICHFPSPLQQAPIGVISSSNPTFRSGYVRVVHAVVK